jgi:hypothetical protein
MGDITTIPIQGTFDIARGRRTLREKVLAMGWKPSFNARAAAALTALGELILLSSAGKTVPVTLRMLEDADDPGILLSCQVNPTDVIADTLDQATERLDQASDDLQIEETSRGFRIAVQVRCYEGKYYESHSRIVS